MTYIELHIPFKDGTHSVTRIPYRPSDKGFAKVGAAIKYMKAILKRDYDRKFATGKLYPRRMPGVHRT